MCYGMGCSYEGYMGECTWDGGMPYPCPEQPVTYVHDEWCSSRPAFGSGECDCYVKLLREKDERIARLEERKQEIMGMLRRAINERVALKAEIVHLKDKLEEVM